MQRHIEETFNRSLADALCAINPQWNDQVCQTEAIGMLAGGPQLRPDILVTEPMAPPVVIECSYATHDADGDACARLGQELTQSGQRIDAAIAVVIPEEFRQLQQQAAYQALRQGTTFGMALFQKCNDGFERFPAAGGHITARLDNLSDLLAVAVVTDERISKLAQTVALRVRQATYWLNTIPSGPRNHIAETMQQNAIGGLQVVALMWLNALLVQHQLHRAGVPDIDPIHFDPAMQPVSTEYLMQWQRILDVNWHSVFRPAVQALENAINYERELRSVMGRLIEGIRCIDTAQLGRHINVGAELFPLLSEDRKQAAAFYTTAGTAEFLARLTIREADLPPDDWSRRDFYEQYRFADLACGTGSLLRAGYHRIASLCRHHGGNLDAEMHRMAMERGIIGVDVSPVATHLTASSLAGLGDHRPYGQTKIGWVEVGRATGRPGEATTGSLEYLVNDATVNLFGEGYGQAAGHEVALETVVIADESIDWILMNPPYSRTRGGQSAFDIAGLTEEQRHQCQKRWGWLIRNLPAIKTAGMAASFLVMASQKIRPGGRIGFVLPLTAAIAKSWAQTRAMIETSFTDITAITVAMGHQAGPLSADTSMSEMMLVARRRTENGVAPDPVNCVTLDMAPARNGIAAELARAVERAVGDLTNTDEEFATIPVLLGATRAGSVVRIPSTGQGEPWMPLGVRSGSLCNFALQLGRGRLLDHGMQGHEFNVPMTTIDNLFDVGPTHDKIGYPRGGSERGAFVVNPVPEGRQFGHDRMLWANNAEIQTSLVVSPTHYGTPRPGEDADSIRETASTLFYNRNLRWTSQKLVAATTALPVMGGRSWVSLRHPDGRVHKAAALWFNSLFGMVVHWTRGQRTQQGRATTQVNAVKGMPVPQFDVLDDEQLDCSAAFLNATCERPLQRLMHAYEDGERSRLDAHTCDMLGLDEQVRDNLNQWCRTFCREPSVLG